MEPLTINQFLDPSDAGAEELCHTVAPGRTISVDKRYQDIVGQVQIWDSFESQDIFRSRVIQTYLNRQIIPRPRWHPWIPDLSRIIYSERMLESLYFSTLLTRVNIALHHAFQSSNSPQAMTIIVCPGAFDSRYLDSAREGAGSTVILPDLLVVEGNYQPQHGRLQRLDQLVSDHKIIAVGDTKLVGRKSDTDRPESKTASGTHSCPRGYLSQVQHYAKMTRTRFGFVLTNKELVLAQFLGEEESSPRNKDQRGLRYTGPVTLDEGLPSNFTEQDSDDSMVDEHRELSFPSRPKRRLDGSGSQGRPPHSPPGLGGSDDRSVDGLGTPRVSSGSSINPGSSPLDYKRAGECSVSGDTASMMDYASSPIRREGSHTSHASEPSLPSPRSQSSPSQTQTSSNLFSPSSGDIEIGAVLVKSFMIPNSYDGEQTEASDLHPAKALFTMLMYASSVGADERKIGPTEFLHGSE